jgi:hypothetical protein
MRYALRGLGWTDMYDLPPYEDRCVLLHLDTLTKRRSIVCVMFIIDVLSGRVNSPNLLSVLYIWLHHDIRLAVAQTGRPLSRIVVPLVYFLFFLS